MSRDRPARIVLITGSSLCHNPRALKSASALAHAGHRVSVLGAWHDAGFKARDQRLMQGLPFQFVPVLDSTLSGPGAQLASFARRAGRRAANLVYGATGLQSHLQLGFGIWRLLREALRSPADLYIAHSEPALHVARTLLRRGLRIGVDLEDWFSEDLLPEARRHRPLALLRSLEKDLLTGSAYASCPSHAMSAALARQYQCAEPAVIYNAFPWAERESLDGCVDDRRNPQVPSVHWFSTTIGPGRGIEDLVAALPLLGHDVEIHLRGRPVPEFTAWVRASLPDRLLSKIFFHPLVTNDRLLNRIAEHDIGFAGEMKHSRNSDLTVSNKILHYLLGGLAVVASDTAGQCEVARQAPEAVQLYPSGDARALAGILNGLLESPERRRHARAAALRAAQHVFCWERQEPALLQAVEAALAK